MGLQASRVTPSFKRVCKGGHSFPGRIAHNTAVMHISKPHSSGSGVQMLIQRKANLTTDAWLPARLHSCEGLRLNNHRNKYPLVHYTFRIQHCAEGDVWHADSLSSTGRNQRGCCGRPLGSPSACYSALASSYGCHPQEII